MAAAVAGITTADCFSCTLFLEAGPTLRPFEPAVTFDYRLIRPEEMRDTSGRAALAQAIRQHARHIQETMQAQTGLQA